jgi:hypothetical protein
MRCTNAEVRYVDAEMTGSKPEATCKNTHTTLQQR